MPNPPQSRSLSDLLIPHHDGSELYVQPQIPIVGEPITLRVRVPKSYTFEKAFIRFYEDGEPRTHELTLESAGTHEEWWKVRLTFTNKTLRYRFVFLAAGKYEWLNSRGVFDYDVLFIAQRS